MPGGIANAETIMAMTAAVPFSTRIQTAQFLCNDLNMILFISRISLSDLNLWLLPHLDLDQLSGPRGPKGNTQVVAISDFLFKAVLSG